jgi:hypothetical protein
VIVVGPVGGDTNKYVTYAKAIATSLNQSPNIDTTLILPPYATWSRVVDAATDADFFAYIGHGNGWPSNMPPGQEDGKDGIGLNPTSGDTNTYHVKYYGANFLIGGSRCSTGIPVPTTKAACTAANGSWKDYGPGIHLAPNAIVLLNHVCFSSGNSSTESTFPNRTTAFQRIDNFAAGFLSIGARVVFGLGWQPGEDLTDAMVSKHMTMDGFFHWTDGQAAQAQYKPWHGWVGDNPAYLESARTPNATVALDPSNSQGFLRGVTGDLGFTFDEWQRRRQRFDAARDHQPFRRTGLRRDSGGRRIAFHLHPQRRRPRGRPHDRAHPLRAVLPGHLDRRDGRSPDRPATDRPATNEPTADRSADRDARSHAVAGRITGTVTARWTGCRRRWRDGRRQGRREGRQARLANRDRGHRWRGCAPLHQLFHGWRHVGRMGRQEQRRGRCPGRHVHDHRHAAGPLRERWCAGGHAHHGPHRDQGTEIDGECLQPSGR